MPSRFGLKVRRYCAYNELYKIQLKNFSVMKIILEMFSDVFIPVPVYSSTPHHERGPGGGEGGTQTNSYGEAPPRGSTPYPFICHF